MSLAGGKGLEPLTSRVRIWRSANWTNPQYLIQDSVSGCQVKRLIQNKIAVRVFCMAGDKGVEPLQTRSQSPARYHYANPQYKQGTWSLLYYRLYYFLKWLEKWDLNPQHIECVIAVCAFYFIWTLLFLLSNTWGRHKHHIVDQWHLLLGPTIYGQSYETATHAYKIKTVSNLP